MTGRNAIKKKDLPKERERERERCFIYIFYAFQHVKLWSANQKGRDTFHAIKKAPSGFFLLFFPKQTTLLPSLSVHFEMNMGIIFFRLL